MAREVSRTIVGILAAVLLIVSIVSSFMALDRVQAGVPIQISSIGQDGHASFQVIQPASAQRTMALSNAQAAVNVLR